MTNDQCISINIELYGSMQNENKTINNDKPRKVVLVGGCFDLLHYGHILFLRRAKELGNWLVVALESDENVKRRKGESRPIHSLEQRIALLKAVSFVDEVIPLPTMEKDTDYDELVKSVQPSVIAVTEGDPYLDHKKIQAARVGARVAEVPKVHTPSTSQLAKLIGLE